MILFDHLVFIILFIYKFDHLHAVTGKENVFGIHCNFITENIMAVQLGCWYEFCVSLNFSVVKIN